jgi:hypothetical protein
LYLCLRGTIVPITAKEIATLTSSSTTSISTGSKEKGSLERRSSPVLPGLYAAPIIAIFGDNFYIYPTTDGSPS